MTIQSWFVCSLQYVLSFVTHMSNHFGLFLEPQTDIPDRNNSVSILTKWGQDLGGQCYPRPEISF